MKLYSRVAYLEPRQKALPSLAKHVVMECHGIPEEKITHAKLKQFATALCEQFDFHVVTNYDHRFSPYGSTIVYVLEESHLAIHSWPEHGYIHCDIVTCSPDNLPFSGLKEFVDNVLSPLHTSILRLKY